MNDGRRALNRSEVEEIIKGNNDLHNLYVTVCMQCYEQYQTNTPIEDWNEADHFIYVPILDKWWLGAFVTACQSCQTATKLSMGVDFDH